MKMSNQAYDILKWIALVLLPALGTLYGALASVWGWPCPDEVVYSVTAVDAFLGALLGLSNIQYQKGQGNED